VTTIAARLVVGHRADYFGGNDTTIRLAAIGLSMVVVVLTTVAVVVYYRRVA
jgi:hypothetical protein